MAKCTCPGSKCRKWKCDDCGAWVHIGEWYACPHGRPHGMLGGFTAYMDYTTSETPKLITTYAQDQERWKPRWENDHVVKYEPREKSDQYYRELNDRREARRREAIKTGEIKERKS